MNLTVSERLPRRRLLCALILAAAVVSALWLNLTPSGLTPSGGGWETTGRFFLNAFQPALDYEDRSGLPADAPAFLSQIARAAVETLRMALAAVSLSIAGGLVLGFLGSRVWWPERRRLLPCLLWVPVRLLMTLIRSVHELIWATIFLAAVGITPLTAAIAIALPYAGTLAKIFAEMAEETPAGTRDAFRALGASPLQMFFCGVLPRMRAELTSYTLYRFECGLRSAAVLGFIGLPTLGLFIQLSFENLHYREVWTALYALLALVVIFDQGSSWVRRRLVSGTTAKKDLPLRCVLLLLAAGIAWAWLSGSWTGDDGATARRGENIRRFLREITPWPIQQGESEWTAVRDWAAHLLFSPGVAGWRAALNTLAISVAAIVLSAVLAWCLIPFAARNVACPAPFLPEPGKSSLTARIAWRLSVFATRSVFMLMRAIPEYIWAFLLIALVSDPSWAAVLALGLHNAGILGRLGAEIVENADHAAPAALRGLGGTRGQVLAAGLVPLSLPRFLVYFFYRWETCLREGTVLGILGIATLGRLIKDSRAFDRYDEMMFFVLLGAALVFLGDLLSLLARRAARA
jgi:phosphonate transport system permease protein